MRRGIHIQHYGFHVRPPPAHLFPKHVDLEQRAISYVTPPLLFNCFDHIHYANILSLSGCTSVTTQLWGSSGLNIDPPQFGFTSLAVFEEREFSDTNTNISSFWEPSAGRTLSGSDDHDGINISEIKVRGIWKTGTKNYSACVVSLKAS